MGGAAARSPHPTGVSPCTYTQAARTAVAAACGMPSAARTLGLRRPAPGLAPCPSIARRAPSPQPPALQTPEPSPQSSAASAASPYLTDRHLSAFHSTPRPSHSTAPFLAPPFVSTAALLFRALLLLLPFSPPSLPLSTPPTDHLSIRPLPSPPLSPFFAFSCSFLPSPSLRLCLSSPVVLLCPLPTLLFLHPLSP